MPCNVSTTERVLTGAAATALAAYGWKKGGIAGGWLMVGAGGLLLRATTGYCPVYALARGDGDTPWPPSTATETKRALSGPRGVRVHTGITIARPVEDVYAFWRDFDNLSRFVPNLESVQAIDSQRSHWIVRGPAGRTVEWDAEIIHEEPNRVIGWRSLAGADVVNAGSVNFDAAPGGRGTEVRVSMQYQPPGGKPGVAVASLVRVEPSQQVREGLRRLKELLEAGEIARAH